MGETILGSGFLMGPGGKGSNQAVAAARAGAQVSFISRIGQDAFGDVALATWKAEGITPRVVQDTDRPTGAAYIFVSEATGDNAIIVVAGAAAAISPADVEKAADAITAARVFVTQLEQPIPAARRGLEIARSAGVVTVFNPAPAAPLPADIFPLCDYIVPNETECTALTGLSVATLDEARKAGDALLAKGVKVALITLGERGALFHARGQSEPIAAYRAGAVMETTGAGDAFVGGFAAGLASGMAPLDAARFGSAGAAISVTRKGTAPSMAWRGEIEALLRGS
jgi:ribokinase